MIKNTPHKFWLNIFLVLTVSIVSCRDNRLLSQSYTHAKEAENSFWTLTGKIANKTLRGDVIAVNIHGQAFKSVIVKNGEFRLDVEGNTLYALHFSTHEINSPRKKHFSTLVYEDSPDVGHKRILALGDINHDEILFLGEIDIVEENAYPSINPSGVLDEDRDGIKDFLDFDDQNDGLSDAPKLDELAYMEICHRKSADSQENIFVPLWEYYPHLLHGDNIGRCEFFNG